MTEFNIERRAAELLPGDYAAGARWRAIILARDTAEAIAAECDKEADSIDSASHAQDRERAAWRAAAMTAMRFARPPAPETREQRLKKALWEMPCTCRFQRYTREGLEYPHAATCSREIARRALEDSDAR